MKLSRLALALAAAQLATSSANSAPLQAFDNGSVVIMTEGRPDGGTPASHFAAPAEGSLQFDAVLDPTSDGGCCAHAEQHFSLTDSGVNANGNISTGGFDSDAQSVLRLGFQVTEATFFHFDGVVEGNGYSFFADDSGLHVLSGPFSFSGLLQPDSVYELQLSVVSLNGQTPSIGHYEMTLTVPDPHGLLLGAMALGTLALARRRTTSSSAPR